MTLKEIQELSIKLTEAIRLVNQEMPYGYHITEDNNGMLLVTNDDTLEQTMLNAKPKLLDKKHLTKKDIEDLFRINKF